VVSKLTASTVRVKEIIWGRKRITGVKSVSGAVFSFQLAVMAALVKSESRAGRKL
jgi:hypothetical protein